MQLKLTDDADVFGSNDRPAKPVHLSVRDLLDAIVFKGGFQTVSHHWEHNRRVIETGEPIPLEQQPAAIADLLFELIELLCKKGLLDKHNLQKLTLDKLSGCSLDIDR